MISTDQLLSINVICVEIELEGRSVPHGTISVGTRAGAEGMMRRYLADLSELQDTYWQEKGVYAATLEHLKFHRTRFPLPIELNVVDGGWSATTTLGGKSCRISAGAALTTGTPSGEVECIELPKPSVPASPATPTAPPAIHIRVGGSGS